MISIIVISNQLKNVLTKESGEVQLPNGVKVNWDGKKKVFTGMAVFICFSKYNDNGVNHFKKTMKMLLKVLLHLGLDQYQLLDLRKISSVQLKQEMIRYLIVVVLL